MDPAASSNNSPLSASVTGNVSSSAGIDGDAQVNDYERTTRSPNSRHEVDFYYLYGAQFNFVGAKFALIRRIDETYCAFEIYW